MSEKINNVDFRTFLLATLWKRANGSMPWPADTLEKEALYLRLAGKFICPEYIFDWPQKDWPHAQEIKEFCAHFPNEQHGFNLRRKYNVMQMLKLIKNVPGDTVECGVYKGATSWLILRHAPEWKGTSRQHHLFDSFEGLSEPDHEDGDHWRKGALACAEDVVRKNLLEFDNRCHYYKGWVPDRFNEVADKTFAFAHIDVDLYEPTKACIEFFYPRMAAGAVILCDDYGSSICPGATRVLNEFLADKPEKMIGFASGGGYFIKGLEI